MKILSHQSQNCGMWVTSNAHKLAQANGVQLWGREQLIDLVIRAKK